MAVSLDTVFKIGAVFTGAAAMQQAQTAVSGLEQRGLLAGLSLKKMVLGLGGITAGYLTVDKLTGFINGSIDAARKAKVAYGGITEALSKVPAMQKLGTAAINEQSARLKALAMQAQRSGVIASEAMASAFTALTNQSFSPAKINEMVGPLQDIIVRTNGIKASSEQAAETATKLGDAIIKGGQEGGTALVQLGVLTQDQVEKFANIKNANDRYNFTLGEMKKHVGDTAEAMKTWDGVQARFQNAWKDITVAVGTPFMQAQDKITEKMGQVQEKLIANAGHISDILTPIISKYADKLADFLVKLIDNIDKYGPALDKFGAIVEKAFSFLLGHGTEVAAGTTAIGAALGVFATAGIVSGNISRITGAITGLHSAWKILSGLNVGGIIALMTNPATWIIVGIAALAAAIYLLVTHWQDVKKYTLEAWESFISCWTGVDKWLQNNVGEPIRKLFTDLPGAIKIAIGDLWVAFVNWALVYHDVDEKIINSIVNCFAGIIVKIPGVLGDLWSAFTKWTDTLVADVNRILIDPIVNAFRGLPDLIRNALSGLANAILQPFQSAWAGLTGWTAGVPGLNKIFNSGAPANVSGGVNTAVGGNAANVSSAIPGGNAGANANNFVPGGSGVTGGATKGTTGTWEGNKINIGSYSGSGLKISSFGYEQPGQADYDSNSYRGIGAFSQNMIPGYSVALSKTGEQMLGVSPRQEFDYQGNKFAFHDRSPQPFPNMDIYHKTNPGFALGGLASHPIVANLAEKVPEMVVPLEGTSRSRSLLGAAAERIGMRTGTGGGGSPVHLNMNAPITVNGVQSGQEGAIAQEVQRAIEDPIRKLLDQLKQARQYESRLSYA